MAGEIITDIPVRGVRETTPPAPVEKVDRKEKTPEHPVVAEEAAETKSTPDVRELERIASEVEIRLKQINTELRFEVRESVNDLVIKVVDPETNEVIKQIPSEEMVEVRDRLDELVGLLLDEKT